MWKQQIGHAIRLFQMRITGQNEGFDSQVRVLPHSFRYSRWIANQCSASTTAHQAYACPEIGTYFQFFAAAAMQLRHAALSFGVEPRECVSRPGDGVVVDI